MVAERGEAKTNLQVPHIKQNSSVLTLVHHNVSTIRKAPQYRQPVVIVRLAVSKVNNSVLIADFALHWVHLYC